MRVLVTGGAGYVGWSVVHSLADSASIEEVVVYDNFSRQNFGLLLGSKPDTSTKIRTVVDDILNSRELRKAMDGIDCVVHLAAISPSPVTDDTPHIFDQVNHWGTAEVSYAAEELGISRLIYSSSGAIYGQSNTPVDSLTTPMPSNSYGRSKLAGEKQVQRLSEKLDLHIIRSGTVHGVNPSVRFDTFVNRFLLRAALGSSVQVNGSGEQVRPVVSVEYLAARILEAVLGKKTADITNEVELNISVNEVLEVLRKHKSGLEVIYINQQQRMPDLVVAPSDELSVYQEGLRKTFEERIADDLKLLSLNSVN